MPDLLENPASNLASFREFASRDQLETPETYLAILRAAIDVLAGQRSIQPVQDLPTIIVPDLHARRELLMAILSTRFSDGPLRDKQVFELLQNGLINVICVGDIVHSEKRSDWVINLNGEWTPELLEKEMLRSLGMSAMVMYLKLRYPHHFHCLRGNHDDVAMEFGPFRKFVGLQFDANGEAVEVDGRSVFTAEKGESGIVKDWVLNREGWGREFLETWAQFERLLPLLAQGSYYIVTHTLPLIPLSLAAFQSPERPRELVEELTSRRGLKPAALEQTLDNLGIRRRVQRWFYGHTRVKTNGGRYEEDLDGLLIRLNNPEEFVCAYVPASTHERLFEPERDVYMQAPDREPTWHMQS